MSVKDSARHLAWLCLLSLTLSGCYHPPFNHFRPDRRPLADVTASTAMGAGMGALAGVAVGGSTATGAGIIAGGITGAVLGQQKNTKGNIIKGLKEHDIQFVQYGDTMTLIVPTDRYFYFNSPRINELCYPGLMDMVKLLRFYKCSPIFVAGFTDDVGAKKHKRLLTQSQAEAMVTFLWANGIPAQKLTPEGYADKHPIGDNDTIRGSAFNRRLEIQWLNLPAKTMCKVASKEPMLTKFGRMK